MNYYMFLEAKSNNHGDSCVVIVNNATSSLKRTEIDVTIYVSRGNNVIEECEYLNIITIMAGSKRINEYISFEVNNLRVSSESSGTKISEIKSAK